MIDFSLTDEQELFVAGVRELMQSQNWESYFAKCDEAHEYPIKWVKALADMGIDTLVLPQSLGGMGQSWVSLVAVWEELGRLGAPTYVLYQLPGLPMIAKYGTKEQRDKIFKFIGTGEQMFNSAITEPSAGSDVGSLKTTYKIQGDDVILNGQKCFITSSAHAPYLIVMAKDADSEKPIFSEWFVDMSLPGIRLTQLEKLGLRMDSCCEISFDNVRLKRSDLFGEIGGGFNRVKEEFDSERFLVACTNYGVALCAFEDAAKYANLRVQFGEAIGRTQLIQEKFAHMTIKLNAMKNMLYETAWKMDKGQNVTADSAMCKYYCANAAFSVVDEAMQVLGGIGVTGHRVSRFWRDLRVDRLSGGSDEMQILTLGRAVLKRYK